MAKRRETDKTPAPPTPMMTRVVQEYREHLADGKRNAIVQANERMLSSASCEGPTGYIRPEYVKGHYKKECPRVLTRRPAGAPSVLDEMEAPVRIVITQDLSPGDVLMLTSALRDLHAAWPGKFITDVRTPCMQLFENNPYITKMPDTGPETGKGDHPETMPPEEALVLYAEYKLIQTSNKGAYHFIHGYRHDLESKLGLPIRPTDPNDKHNRRELIPFKGDIHLSDQEKSWYSQVREMLGADLPYWIIDAGCKTDFTAKLWEVARYQQVVERCPELLFVQIGSVGSRHRHIPLRGENVLNLIGKTDLRQLVRLVYHSAGVITPVSFPMHLAAAVPVHPRYNRKTRPCVVIAGGREPSHWEAYPTHRYLHTCGMLPCCDHGGCWKSRVQPIGDKDEKDNEDKLCSRPVKALSGQIIPQCMDMITADMVVDSIRGYLSEYDYSDDNPGKWCCPVYVKPDGAMKARDPIFNAECLGYTLKRMDDDEPEKGAS